MANRTNRKFTPLWIVLVVATILVLIAYSFIFWTPGEQADEGEIVPAPLTAPQ